MITSPMDWLRKNSPTFFKKKGTEKGLWLSSAPEWVLPGLEKLGIDIKVIGEMERPSKLDSSWKNLVENQINGGTIEQTREIRKDQILSTKRLVKRYG